jgi:hypothetical protein
MFLDALEINTHKPFNLMQIFGEAVKERVMHWRWDGDLFGLKSDDRLRFSFNFILIFSWSDLVSFALMLLALAYLLPWCLLSPSILYTVSCPTPVILIDSCPIFIFPVLICKLPSKKLSSRKGLTFF